MAVQITFTVDGESFIIETTKDKDVSFLLPGNMTEEIRLSSSSTQLLVSALITAIADLEEGE